jgi:CHAD domain-containing protein
MGFDLPPLAAAIPLAPAADGLGAVEANPMELSPVEPVAAEAVAVEPLAVEPLAVAAFFAENAAPAISPETWGLAPPRLDWRIGPVPAVRRALSELAERAAAIAAAASAEPHKAVHAQRRTLRRGRALLRLLGPCMAAAQAKDWLGRLGEASRQLGVFRDADVLPAALRLLGNADRDAVAQLREQLSADRDAARADPNAILQVRSTADVLLSVALEAQGAELELSPPKLARSLQASMRRARALARQANKHPRPEAVHELRKRAKDLRHQLEWLGVRSGDEALDGLVDWLGDLGEVADLLALQAWLKERSSRTPQRGEILLALRLSKAKRARRCLRDAKVALPGHAKRRARAIVVAALARELPA